MLSGEAGSAELHSWTGITDDCRGFDKHQRYKTRHL